MKDTLLREENSPNEKKTVFAYLVFFLFVLAVLISFSLIDAVRDYTIPALIAVFLIGGTAASLTASDLPFKKQLISFGKGALSVLPTVLLILMASAVKYILVEGKVLPTITNAINGVVAGRDPYSLAPVRHRAGAGILHLLLDREGDLRHVHLKRPDAGAVERDAGAGLHLCRRLYEPALPHFSGPADRIIHDRLFLFQMGQKVLATVCRHLYAGHRIPPVGHFHRILIFLPSKKQPLQT